MLKRELIAEVRAMLERQWDAHEIASKLKLDPAAIQAIIDTINNILT